MPRHVILIQRECKKVYLYANFMLQYHCKYCSSIHPMPPFYIICSIVLVPVAFHCMAYCTNWQPVFEHVGINFHNERHFYWHVKSGGLPACFTAPRGTPIPVIQYVRQYSCKCCSKYLAPGMHMTFLTSMETARFFLRRNHDPFCSPFVHLVE